MDILIKSIHICRLFIEFCLLNKQIYYNSNILIQKLKQFSKMKHDNSNLFIEKDNLVNYQRQVMSSSFDGLPKPTSRSDSKYTIFQINDKIKSIVGEDKYNIRWIGNDRNSYIQAYIYSLLMLSLTNAETFLKFKKALYELSRKYLNIQKQKLLIEFFCLIEHSSDKFLFLKKYPLIQNILIGILRKLQSNKKYGLLENIDLFESIFSSQRPKMQSEVEESIFQQQERRMNDSQISIIDSLKLCQIYNIFSSRFQHIICKKISSSIFKLSILTQQLQYKMFIILEKQYFFTVQILDKKVKKHKLQQADRNQVQRLLGGQNKKPQDNTKWKTLSNSNQSQKELHFLDIKTESMLIDRQKKIATSKFNSMTNIGYPKRDTKLPSFAKKPKTNINNQERRSQNKIQYIDLMQSSFEQQEKTNSGIHKQINKVQTSQQIHQTSINIKQLTKKPSIKIYQKYPKFISPKKSIQKYKSPEHFFNTRKRSPTNHEPNNLKNKSNLSISNRQSSALKNKIKSQISVQVNGNGNKKNDKEIYFNKKSPILRETQDPIKQQPIKFDQRQIKFDEKVFQKKTQNDLNVKVEEDKNKHTNMQSPKESSQFQPFNNRISLQTRNQLYMLPHRVPTLPILSVQPQKRIQQSVKQSLQPSHNKSQYYLKKRIIEHVSTKLAQSDVNAGFKFDFKRNRSYENRDLNLQINANKQQRQYNQQVTKLMQYSQHFNNHSEHIIN